MYVKNITLYLIIFEWLNFWGEDSIVLIFSIKFEQWRTATIQAKGIGNPGKTGKD